jgi:hypothetical protein
MYGGISRIMNLNQAFCLCRDVKVFLAFCWDICKCKRFGYLQEIIFYSVVPEDLAELLFTISFSAIGRFSRLLDLHWMPRKIPEDAQVAF